MTNTNQRDDDCADVALAAEIYRRRESKMDSIGIRNWLQDVVIWSLLVLSAILAIWSISNLPTSEPTTSEETTTPSKWERVDPDPYGGTWRLSVDGGHIYYIREGETAVFVPDSSN